MNLKSREVGLKIFFLSLELKKYTRFLEMCHFSKWNIAKSDATLLHVSKNTTLLQKSAASTQGLPKAILVQSTTASVN